ncbi:hypothetical protein [Vibrio rotiferianus]|uniref:hypothetical protein n=1 Tax=Vibrio rotiferianus TaxID=190895 RepID=UPI001110F024|nr:hypothetical protein [Vibrio rotiferianus]TMX60962.1 hypothetical protein DA097_17095 [Vibrio rotiferianus]
MNLDLKDIYGSDDYKELLPYVEILYKEYPEIFESEKESRYFRGAFLISCRDSFENLEPFYLNELPFIRRLSQLYGIKRLYRKPYYWNIYNSFLLTQLDMISYGNNLHREEAYTATFLNSLKKNSQLLNIIDNTLVSKFSLSTIDLQRGDRERTTGSDFIMFLELSENCIIPVAFQVKRTQSIECDISRENKVGYQSEMLKNLEVTSYYLIFTEKSNEINKPVFPLVKHSHYIASGTKSTNILENTYSIQHLIAKILHYPTSFTNYNSPSEAISSFKNIGLSLSDFETVMVFSQNPLASKNYVVEEIGKTIKCNEKSEA